MRVHSNFIPFLIICYFSLVFSQDENSNITNIEDPTGICSLTGQANMNVKCF